MTWLVAGRALCYRSAELAAFEGPKTVAVRITTIASHSGISRIPIRPVYIAVRFVDGSSVVELARNRSATVEPADELRRETLQRPFEVPAAPRGITTVSASAHSRSCSQRPHEGRRTIASMKGCNSSH